MAESQVGIWNCNVCNKQHGMWPWSEFKKLEIWICGLNGCWDIGMHACTQVVVKFSLQIMPFNDRACQIELSEDNSLRLWKLSSRQKKTCLPLN